MLDRAGLDVDQEEIGVAGALVAAHRDDPAAVRRDRVDPDVTAELEDCLLPARELVDDDVEVAAVAAVRRVGEQPAVARDVRRPVVEARVADERAFPEDVELRPLVPGLVDLDEHTAVRKVEPFDGLGVVRELLELTTVRGRVKS